MNPIRVRRPWLGGALTLLCVACQAPAPLPSEALDAGPARLTGWQAEGSGDLGAQRLSAAQNTLSFETALSARNGWGPVERDRSNGEQGAGDGRPLTLDGRVYPRGLGVHAASSLEFDLRGYNNAVCTRFTAEVGVDDEVGRRGSVEFQVYLDGALTFGSGRMTGADAARNVAVNLSGHRMLKLVVTDAGDGVAHDHADWAAPTVSCAWAGQQIDYGFQFGPPSVSARAGETATATLVVTERPIRDTVVPSGPVAFQLKVRMASSPGDITLAEPSKVYSAATFPAHFPVRVHMNAACPTCPPGSRQRIELEPLLEDFTSGFGALHRFDLFWDVLPTAP